MFPFLNANVVKLIGPSLNHIGITSNSASVKPRYQGTSGSIEMQFRKWRPSHKCIYVVSELHGNCDSLEVILNKILPLRKFKHQEDQIVLLGDYVDGDEGGHKILDTLINIKAEYKDRVVCLKGNHEDLMLRAIYGSEDDYRYWLDKKGASTLTGYIKRNELDISPFSVVKSRLTDLIPKTHIEFLQSLDLVHQYEGYCFFHGGFNVAKSIKENSPGSFMHDYLASKYVKDCVKNGQEISLQDDCVFVGAHNFNGQEPFIHKRYMMLGGSAPNRIVVFELNSMTYGYVSRNSSRIITDKFEAFE